jgi:hypothetical protein
VAAILILIYWCGGVSDIEILLCGNSHIGILLFWDSDIDILLFWRFWYWYTAVTAILILILLNTAGGGDWYWYSLILIYSAGGGDWYWYTLILVLLVAAIDIDTLWYWYTLLVAAIDIDTLWYWYCWWRRLILILSDIDTGTTFWDDNTFLAFDASTWLNEMQRQSCHVCSGVYLYMTWLTVLFLYVPADSMTALSVSSLLLDLCLAKRFASPLGFKSSKEITLRTKKDVHGLCMHAFFKVPITCDLWERGLNDWNRSLPLSNHIFLGFEKVRYDTVGLEIVRQGDIICDE